ncbi:MAG: IucA/IucC family C-terminal-domain containing protein, partial [Corynebacterium matruchotii]
GLPCDLLPEIAGCAYDGPKTNPRAVRGLSTLIRKSTPRTAITAAALRGLPTVTEEFFSRYARDLLSTVLPTMWHAGIALEAHLQNTLVYVDDDFQYQGICLRDFSGLRAYLPRATGVPIRDGAITMTDDYDVFIAKGYYAAIPGNLAAFVDQLPGDPRHYWRLVRSIVTDLIAEHNPPQADVDKLLAPTMKQKAFLRMLADPARGDVYVDVPNPLVG